MKCPRCKEDIIKELRLFNGTWVCPKCKKVIYDENNQIHAKFKITVDNNELYVQSEFCYHQALKSSSNDEYEKYMKLSFEKCEQSAEDYNPMAFLKMGDFYAKGILINTTDIEAKKVALRYYSILSFADSLSDETNKCSDFYELRKKAAIHLLNMLAEMPNSSDDLFNYSKKEKQLKTIFPDLVGYKKNDTTITKNTDDIKMLFTDSIYSSNPPIIGILKVSKEDALELVKDTNITKNIGNNGLLFYWGYEYDGRICFTNINEVEKINSFDNEYLYLYFFNVARNLNHYSKADLKKIRKYINESGSYKTISNIIDNCKKILDSDYDNYLLFTEDDLIYFTEHKKINKQKFGNPINTISELE